MPNIEVSHKDLCGMIGRKLSVEQLRDEILYAKGELDEVSGDALKIDIKDTNRPDLWSAEGVAREVRARQKPGMPKYSAKKSGLTIIVDSSVEKVRPYTTCAIVKGLRFDENVMSQLIQLQEKVAGTFGRNRKEVAIGVYDFHRIKFPVTFRGIRPNELKFVPLGLEEKMTPEDILEKHPKGREYGHLLKNEVLYPVFIDKAKEVLSMPPIINSNYSGKVTEKTRDVFIECSGFDLKFLNTALNVMVAALAERGGQVYSVKVKYGKKILVTPDLAPKKFYANADYIRKVSGLDINDREISELLRKSLYDVKIKGKKIELLYPAYRQDIMHERDIVEDALISYGFNEIEPETPRIHTKGGISRAHALVKRLSRIMVGAGFQEILSYTLTNTENLHRRMNVDGKVVEIGNPVSNTWSVFRTSMLPNLMEFFASNMHREYPQMVFETGNVVISDPDAETRARDVRMLAAALTASSVSYEGISSHLDAVLRNLGIAYKLRKAGHPSFIDGRVAEILVNEKVIGHIGEISPAVLNNWGLEMPVVAFEISLNEIFEKLR